MPDFFRNLSEEQFTHFSLIICLTGLIVLMGWIVYKLARQSKAGKYGTLVLFFVLGFGVTGFIIKTILTEILEKGGL